MDQKLPHKSQKPTTTTKPENAVTMTVFYQSQPVLRQLELHENDILCTKDKSLRNHPGNCLFRAHIDKILPTYKLTKSKLEKMNITKRVVHDLKMNHKVRFVKFDEETASWIEVDSNIAREKVGHAIRFALRRQEKQALKVNKKTRKCHPLRFAISMNETTVSDTDSSEDEETREEKPETTTSSPAAVIVHEQKQKEHFSKSSHNKLADNFESLESSPAAVIVHEQKQKEHFSKMSHNKLADNFESLEYDDLPPPQTWSSEDFSFLLGEANLFEDSFSFSS